MERDFTERARQELLSLVAQVEDEKLCDFTDWIGDRWYDFQEWIGKLNIKNYLDDVNSYHKKVIDKNNATSSKINQIFADVNEVSADYKGRVEAVLENIRALERMVDRLSETIDPAKSLFTSMNSYLILRLEISTYLNQSKNLSNIAVKDLPDSNPAFDDDGTYGGNQGSAMKVYTDKEIQSIVRKYYPDYSDKEVKVLLEKMNSEGCGYVAMCNTIFAEFTGREERFEKILGFPMYKDGDLNYDALIVDFYCSKDDSSKSGTNWHEREKIWEEYMMEHGIVVDVVCGINLTIDNYEKIVKKGQIVVAVSPVILEDEKGNVVVNSKGGHAMTVTGVTEDGRYIVSSWGKKYYIEPSEDFDRLQFQQVRYKDA